MDTEGYNPQKENISYYLNQVYFSLDQLLAKYENILLIGDFSASVNEDKMKDFCDIYNLKNLINEPTCFKSAINPSSIDVILTNRKTRFGSSAAIETGLSDHHKLTVSVIDTLRKGHDAPIIRGEKLGVKIKVGYIYSNA